MSYLYSESITVGTIRYNITHYYIRTFIISNSCWKFISVQSFLSMFGVISIELFITLSVMTILFPFHQKKFYIGMFWNDLCWSDSLNKNISRHHSWWQWRCNRGMCCCRNFRNRIILNELAGRIRWTIAGEMFSEWICRNESSKYFSEQITLDVNIITGNIFRNRLYVSEDRCQKMCVGIIISAYVFQQMCIGI